MKITPLDIQDLMLIEPKLFEDDRGFFFESFNLNELRKAISLDISFVQDNHSKSFQGVLRGLHYQVPPYSQGKVVRVIKGEIFDVVVDLRKSSPTFGHHITQILSAKNKKQVWIPRGFAHGFLTLSKFAEVLYKTTDFYMPNYEECILWNDPVLKINWPEKLHINLSEKDLKGKKFNQAYYFL